MVQTEFTGDGQKTAIVIPAGTRGVTNPSGGGNSVDGLVQQPFKRRSGAADGYGLIDQGLWGSQIRQIDVVLLNVGPGHRQLGSKNRTSRHIVITQRDSA
jgi:hypothetical protein